MHDLCGAGDGTWSFPHDKQVLYRLNHILSSYIKGYFKEAMCMCDVYVWVMCVSCVYVHMFISVLGNFLSSLYLTALYPVFQSFQSQRGKGTL